MYRFTIKKAVILMAMLLFASAAGATEKNTKVSGLIYHVPISYHDSLLKDDASVNGVYLYYGVGDSRSYEVAFDETEITYIPDTGYTQHDVTLAYTTYSLKKKNRYGAHFISSTTDTNDGFTVFAGGSKYRSPETSLNLDVYYSSYDNMTPDISVIQISPAIGRTISNKDGNAIYSLTSVHYIKLSEDIALAGDSFLSVEQSVTFKQEKFSATFHGWLGEQMFAVSGSGFTVYNKPELNEAGYGASFNFILNEETNLTLGADEERFKDTGTRHSAKGRKYTIMLGHTF